MKYKVTSRRWDVVEHEVARFETNSDKEAKNRFDKEFKNNPRYIWDWLTLIQYEDRVVEMWQKRPE